MELVRTFGSLNKYDAAIAGGKGASLGEMTQAGIPVPPGFVVLADTFERFLHEADLLQEIDAIVGTVEHSRDAYGRACLREDTGVDIDGTDAGRHSRGDKKKL